MRIPLTDEAINALMDHQFAIADGRAPASVSLAPVVDLDTMEIEMSSYITQYSEKDRWWENEDIKGWLKASRQEIVADKSAKPATK